MNARIAWVSLMMAGCTFGGSDEDPSHGLRPTSAHPSMDSGVLGSDEPEDELPPPTDDPVRMDASTDGAIVGDAGGGMRRDGDSPGEGGGDDRCTPRPAVPVCDPVKNKGCGALTQCSLDPETTKQSGRCVLWTLALIGCRANAISTTCEGTRACVDGACKKMCYCDADCAAGTRCTGRAPFAMGPVKICQ